MYGSSRRQSPVAKDPIERSPTKTNHGILARIANDEPERLEIEESRLSRNPLFPVELKPDRITPHSLEAEKLGSWEARKLGFRSFRASGLLRFFA